MFVMCCTDLTSSIITRFLLFLLLNTQGCQYSSFSLSSGRTGKVEGKVIWRPVGDAASKLIFSVQYCLDTQLLPVLGQEMCMYAETGDD